MKNFRLSLPLLVLLASSLGAQSPSTDPRSLALQPIRYDALAQRVVDLEGRVVVVVFWANYCMPCRQKFPSLMALHRKYADQGLVMLTVALDEPFDPQTERRISHFLSSQAAHTENYWLHEKHPLWQARLRIDGPPCIFLFDRHGRLIKKYHGYVDFNELNYRIDTLLK